MKIMSNHARTRGELLILAANRYQSSAYARKQSPGANVEVSRAHLDAGTIAIAFLLATSLLGTAVCFAYHFIG